jgi:hypothetical protein
MSFNQSAPTVPTVINASSTLLYGNAVSSNALTVRQFGTGNVFSVSNAAGTVGLFVSATSNVGIGVTGPLAPLHLFVGDVIPTGSGNMSNGFIVSSASGGVALNIGTKTNTDQYSWIQSAYTNNSGVGAHLCMQPTAGRVGIGTTSPGFPLHVQGSAAIVGGASQGRTEFNGDSVEIGNGRTSDGNSFIDLHTAEATYPDYSLRIIRFSGANGVTQILQRGTGEISYVTVDAADHAWYTSNAEKMRLTAAGRVGVGTASPSYPLHVNGFVTSPSLATRYFNYATALTQANQTTNLSIYASNDIGAGNNIVSFSDRRAKVLEESPSESYMNLVDKIQVHQYSWIDKIGKGSTKKIGFFAQEVEAVVPDAVGQTTGVIPTIYRQADAFTGTTITVQGHGITTEKKLEVVDPENGKTKIDIVRVIDADNLEVKFEKVPKDKLFVVGPEVDDSRMVNHDYLMAVGFGGLKELSSLVKTQAQTISSLEARLAALEAKLNSQ